MTALQASLKKGSKGGFVLVGGCAKVGQAQAEQWAVSEARLDWMQMTTLKVSTTEKPGMPSPCSAAPSSPAPPPAPSAPDPAPRSASNQIIRLIPNSRCKKERLSPRLPDKAFSRSSPVFSFSAFLNRCLCCAAG